MKSAVFGISMLVLAGIAGQINAVEEAGQNQAAPMPSANNPENTPSQVTTAPGSLERIKEKLDAMNSHSTPGLEGVVKMYQSGVDKGVIETYIKNSRLPTPTPRDIIYLHDQGIPQELLTALIDHGHELEEQAAKAAAAAPQPPVIDPSAVTYNNFVYNSPGATIPATYGADYTSTYGNNNLLIIPYNPYRNYYQSYYSAPFYGSYYSPWSYNYSPWGYSPGYSFGGFPSYAPYFSIPFRPSWHSRGFAFNGPRAGGPHFGGPGPGGGPRFGGPAPGGGPRMGGPGPGRGPGGPPPDGGFRR